MKSFTIQLLLGLSFLLHSCTETIDPPPPSTNVIQLSLQEASYSKAFLKITLPDTLTPRSVVLKRNGTVVATLLMQKRDTIIVDSNLVPKTTYTYLALRMRDTTAIEQSQPLQVTTRLKNPREFSWSLDTISYPGSYQTFMQSIFAISPRDIFIVGHNERGYGKMYHFDGNVWADVKLSILQGGNIIGAIDLRSLFGFAGRKIFAVGEELWSNPRPPPSVLDSSIIIRFDGQTWWKEPLESRGRWLNTIWGASENDLWAGGAYGTLYHYDGVRWKKITFDSTTTIVNIFGFSGTEVYATGYDQTKGNSPNDTSKTMMYHFDGNKWTLLATNRYYKGYKEETFGATKMWGLSPDLFYSISAYSIYKWEGGSWKRLATTTNAFLSIYGTGPDNIYVVGINNEVFHFNGSNWYRVEQIPYRDVLFRDVWCTEEEVFIVGYDANKTIVYHGK